MDSKRLYIDFHVLQTVPPSCVNRDDTGSPKTAVYGGATRARVSSQAWKRAMRLMYREELLAREQLGERTKKIVAVVAGEIAALSPESDAAKLAKTALENAGLKKVTDEKGTDALFFMSHAQARALAELAVQGCEDKQAYKKALKDDPSADMALFGRMVASDPSLNYDAAAQVAHSISTHAVQNEYDYFTAVDDCAPADNAGAGHLGTVEYNSSTLYRYATVNAVELAASLGRAETPGVVRAFAEAFIRSMPTGKQNTFANRTLPDAVYITVRCDQPVNLCGAFEKAIPPSEEGFVEPSKRRLAAYARQVYQDYTGNPAQAFAVGTGLEELAQTMPLGGALDALEAAVRQHMSGNGVE
ncbi:MAG: type I-E CRISPR-associated protein Cas7/Cse4/CasC [Bacillota bacterium]|nr:MAG: type I-E CRISPR-associated protein Cas7/Cse4/CasC [Bacillota bacterium]